MRNLIFLLLFFGFFGCSPQDDPAQNIPLEIGLRKTVEEIAGVPAFLDVETITNGTETSYLFFFELQDNAQKRRLVPDKDTLICSLLNEQLMYGMTIIEGCADVGYFFRYLRYGEAPGNHRMHVTISGKAKERRPGDPFTGSPFVLERIEKIESCPVAITDKSGSFSLENRFWKLVGFIDQNGNIISSPTCENPEIGITFYDKLLTGSPIEDPEAKSFKIESAVWIRSYQLFLVYGKESDNKLRITRAVDPAWMPPRPATAQTNNIDQLTKGIYNKFDSLSQIFLFNQTVDFEINGNKIELRNPTNGIGALLITN